MLMQSHILMTVLYIDYRTVPHACALAHARPTMSHFPLVIWNHINPADDRSVFGHSSVYF